MRHPSRMSRSSELVLIAVVALVAAACVSVAPTQLSVGSSTPASSVSRLAGPTTSVAASSPGSQPTPGPSFGPTSAGSTATSGSGTPADPSGTRPWLAFRPRGAGAISKITLPAPWVGGTRDRAQVWIYLPPGYGTAGRDYPVIYEVPWSYTSWSKIGIAHTLDGLADTGIIPGHIVAFVSEGGGPYPDGECIDTPDHRESFESYLTGTVVPYVDGHYRTVASAAGRSLLGMSQGGFCSAMLELRHPDLFATAISFSGYFVAAIRSSETANASHAYDGNQAAIRAYSPMAIVGTVPPDLRGSLLFELSADSNDSFYGRQYRAFNGVLRAAGIHVALFPTPYGHGWTAPRVQLRQVLATLATHEMALGLYRP